MESVDLMLLGHLARDEVVVEGTTRHRIGGAVYFGAHAFCAASGSCLVVTKLRPGDERLLDELPSTSRVHWTPSATTVGIRNIYSTPDQDRRQCVLLGAGDPFSIDDLPAGVAPTAIHVGALIAGQVPDSLLPKLAQRAQLGLDAQGVLRTVEDKDQLRLRPWVDASHYLPLVTYFKADAAEAEILTGESDLDRAAEALAAMGPREVVLTHADQVRVQVGQEVHRAPFTSRTLQGRTGRGDTCMCAYLSARLEGKDPGWATRYAAALTSIKMEKDGPFSGSRQEVLERMNTA